MNTITLNLLAEEQLAQHAQARDPFKLTVAIGIGLCAICMVIGSCVSHAVARYRTNADALQSRVDSLVGKTSPTGDTKTIKALVDDILTINRARQLYAPQLALIKDIVPEYIQLDQVSFSTSVEAGPPVPAEAAGGEEKGNAKAARAARPTSTERLVLHLSGQAVSSRPEIEVDQFIKSMRTNPSFSSQITEIKLKAIARSPASSDSRVATLPSASFVIDCQYKERR